MLLLMFAKGAQGMSGKQDACNADCSLLCSLWASYGICVMCD